jgi:tRNA pseudouridine55 synthase
MKLSGFLLVDKSAGITSHNVVSIARREFKEKRIGHAGTLDPFATGLLVLGIGKATRLLQYIVEKEKVYLATIRLGASSSTDDLTGELSTGDLTKLANLTDENIKAELNNFVGKIKQRPSSVSAIKVDGKRAYQLVREGEEVILKEREVEIFALTVNQISRGDKFIDIEIEVKVSAGTYIRAIARDLGEKLGVGGYLTTLRRDSIGQLKVENATKIEERTFTNPQIISIADGLANSLPVRIADLMEENEISFGRALTPNPTDEIYLTLNSKQDALALVQNKDGQGRPILVLMGE